jgi:hypothetical protein
MMRVRGAMTPCRPPKICPHHPLVLRKSNPRRSAGNSPLQLLSLHQGEGKADRGIKWFVWGGLVQLNVGKASNVHVVSEIYVNATTVSNRSMSMELVNILNSEGDWK